MQKNLLDRTLSPVHKFIHFEHSGGIVLFIAVIIALILANSPFQHAYGEFWETPLDIEFGSRHLDYTLHEWVNDGLMAMFFFIVGLELKREMIAGELASFRKALLPFMAALGGMLVPAAIYMSMNHGLPSASGWGIPMATDIVFTLALMGVVSKRVPLAAKVFLVALATVDDLGAVVVIALFYSSDLSLFNLSVGLIILAILLIANFVGVRNIFFYAVLGIGGVWLAFLLSGVHATIAGVLVAFAIPARTKVDENEYAQHIQGLMNEFKKEIPLKGPLTTVKQHDIIEEVKNISYSAQTPLQKLETVLHPWVSFVIVPLFALSNAGVAIGGSFFKDLLNPVSLGIIAGLVVGKCVGIFLFTWILARLKITSLPGNTGWKHILGLSLLAGMGFTMSLFVTNLAFDDTHFITQAKYGILLASLLAAILGVVVLKGTGKTEG
ncbi:Na+/H+ antiporter NhaA [Sinomicrobium pectinilyticum]|uniref:Na(+)/H(+) antiporter NhaA n=1 Tax=Sinomicrobium pectinilyticum TaxID=1084421 RepID=A0A3N0DR92_SINP1|nr:Na+/H+ antiporter NhaA [Sinomicrobium pectinilyticum]RNL78170.1 Na+/H+ antiporter NhaA [Sinomicrobium pectinilyticum]